MYPRIIFERVSPSRLDQDSDPHREKREVPESGSKADSAQRTMNPDTLLVQRIQQGDEDAFTIIVRKYINSATRFANYMVHSRDIADDIVQGTFVYLWENRNVLDPEKSLKSYIFTAVRNKILNERKATRVRERYSQITQAESTAGVGKTYVPSAENQILTEVAVHEALCMLSERRQLAVRLRIQEEMTHAEIGEILEITTDNAKKLVNRGLAELRNFLGIVSP